MQKKLDDLIEFYTKVADRKADEAMSYIKREIVNLLIFGAIFVLVSLSVITGVTRAVRNPIERLRQILARVREGELSVNIDIASSDEIGIMARDLAEALTSMRALIEEAKHVFVSLTSSSEELSAINKQFSVSIDNQAEKATQL